MGECVCPVKALMKSDEDWETALEELVHFPIFLFSKHFTKLFKALKLICKLFSHFKRCEHIIKAPAVTEPHVTR